MKKQITKLSGLFLVFFMASVTLSLNAENRIYIIGGDAVPSAPTYKKYMYDDIWIWQQDWTAEKEFTANAEAGIDEGPTGMYIQYIATVNSYIGLSFVWKSDRDLTQVTDDWYLHLQVKTNVTTVGDSFKMILKGAKKPNGTEDTEATFEFNEDVYPIASRDDATWYEIVIPMYEFFDKGLDFSQPTTGTIAYLNLLVGGTTPGVSKFAIDNVYFTDGESSGISEVKEILDFTISGNTLTLAEGGKATIYDVQGKLVMSVAETADLSSLSKGVYIVRSGNKVAKFIK